MDHHLLDKNFTERSHPKGTQEYPEDPILNKKLNPQSHSHPPKQRSYLQKTSRIAPAFNNHEPEAQGTTHNHQLGDHKNNLYITL